ncbi:hypothetical protein FDB83_13310, partial [Clostridium sporogenes]|nr:hypothetical protein [Clostridium sporogenes]
ALYELACGSTRNDEIYEICCAGIKRKQSKVVFEEAKLMLKGSKLSWMDKGYISSSAKCN